jgi:hypothetical protein
MTMRGVASPLDCSGGGGVRLNASPMVGCHVALATTRGHGWFGRLPQFGFRMWRHRGAMVRSLSLGVGMIDLSLRQEAASLEVSNTPR